MKQQIAGFMGELAEELGWAPELADARVRPEVSQPATPRKPALLSADRDPNSLATPVDRMLRELEQLRATVKHLGTEVIQLRAQMAHLRRLPSPPDADETNVAEAAGSGVAVAAAPPIEPLRLTEMLSPMLSPERMLRSPGPDLGGLGSSPRLLRKLRQQSPSMNLSQSDRLP